MLENDDLSSKVSAYKRYTDISELTGEKPTRPFADITIPVPWGHISGKWYGPQNIRPVLGLHGWLENASTFDRLVPLLDEGIALLSIDLPGNGLSSRLPDGCFYNQSDNIGVIRLIMNQYGWQRVSIIGHSMSAIIAFTFAALFPDKVDMIICLDALKPHIRQDEKILKTMATRIEECLKEDLRNRRNEEPPSYMYNELIDRMFVGTFHSLDKANCKYLLARNVLKSQKYPDKYFFSRDRRIKFHQYSVGSQSLTVQMAKRISCHHMFIKARASSYFEEKKNYDEVLEVLKKKKNFTYLEVEGTHHVHLNNPQLISDEINRFIKNYGPKLNEPLTSKL